jgi:GT2 family glycosyltransferase
MNSGALISTKVLEQIGGYDPWYWLDHSDSRIFARFQAFGKSVVVASDVRILHDFSMKNMDERLTPYRYRHQLLAESAFWDTEMNWLAGCERSLRLVFRYIRLLSKGDKSDLSRITLEFIGKRLFRRKRYRIASWREAVRSHLGGRLEETALPARPLKVSVCMASYDGADYIGEQIASILAQLRLTDELIIVDDCSRDNTVAVIRSINDSRIRLFLNPVNIGAVGSFERAIRIATGDVLMLSDDDDIWLTGKVAKYLAVFERRPDVVIVSSQVQLIDREGTRFDDARLTRSGKFASGFWKNVIKNHYQGSNMALRAELLERVLPFPKKPPFLHDVWIGTRSDLSGGSTVFLDEPLLLYRRHGRNSSRRLPFASQVMQRVCLLWAHLVYSFRRCSAA